MNSNNATLPTIVNVICPRCRKTWMNKNGVDKFYFCYCCSFILFDRQVEKSLDKTPINWYSKAALIQLKIVNFFDNPWIAFPLMILSLVLFVKFGLKYCR